MAEQDEKPNEYVKYTCCSNNGCYSDICLIKCHVKDNKITLIEPDDTINAGYPREDDIAENIDKGLVQIRACSQGYAWNAEIDADDRVLYPMKQVGKRGEGKFVRISWDEAIDTIVEKMQYVIEHFGNYSMFYTAYSAYKWIRGFPLSPWYPGEVMGYRGQSWAGPDLSEEFWLGFTITDTMGGLPTSVPTGFETPDLFNSNLIVLWGWNPTAGSFGSIPYYLKLAKERGIPIICIEPRLTWSAEICADQWIPIRPTTDLTMMLAIANVLIKEDLCDKEYMQTWVDLTGFEKLKAYIMGDEDGVEKTPEWAAPICGVPAETITDFARLYARSKPVHLRAWIGLSKTHRGEYTNAMASILQAMTGNLTIPGGAEPGISFGCSSHLTMPTVDWGRAPVEYGPEVLMVTSRWAEAILSHRDYEEGKISRTEYANLIGNKPTNPVPNIQMLIFNNNWLNNFHDSNKRYKAATLTYFNWGFQWHQSSPTMRYCDIVLPAPIVDIESTDSMMPAAWNPSRFQMGITGNYNYWEYWDKIVDPPAEIRPEWWAWTAIAKGLGIVDKFNPKLKDVSWENWDDEVIKLHKEAYEKWADDPMTPYTLGYYPPGWDEFLKHPIIRVPIDDPHYAFKEYVEAGMSPFRTPTGKVEPYSNLAAFLSGEEWDEEAFRNNPKSYEVLNGYYIEEGYDWDTSEFGGKIDPLPRWEPSYMPGPAYNSFYDKKAKKYPLELITPVTTYRQHSSNDQNPLIKDDVCRHAVWISVPDAKTRGIADGEKIHIFSETGEAVMPAHVTSRCTPGTVVIHHGAWYMPDKNIRTELSPYGLDMRGAPNNLLADKFLPHLVGALLNNGLVEIEKWDPEAFKDKMIDFDSWEPPVKDEVLR